MPRGSALSALPTSLIFRVVSTLPLLSPAPCSRLVSRPLLLNALARASLLHVDRNENRHQRQAWASMMTRTHLGSDVCGGLLNGSLGLVGISSLVSSSVETSHRGKYVASTLVTETLLRTFANLLTHAMNKNK